MKICLKLIKSKILIIRNYKANDIINNLPKDKEENELVKQTLNLKMKKNTVGYNHHLFSLKRSNSKEDSLNIDKIHHIHRENQRTEGNNLLYQYPPNFLKQVKYNPWEYLKDNSSSNSLKKNPIYKDRYDYVDCDIDYNQYLKEFNTKNYEISNDKSDYSNRKMNINKSLNIKDNNIIGFKENEYNNYINGRMQNNIKTNIENKHSINKFKILNMHNSMVDQTKTNVNENILNKNKFHSNVGMNDSTSKNENLNINPTNEESIKKNYFSKNEANYNNNFQDILKISNKSKKRQKVRFFENLES